jgi:hypothetical protein
MANKSSATQLFDVRPEKSRTRRSLIFASSHGVAEASEGLTSSVMVKSQSLHEKIVA